MHYGLTLLQDTLIFLALRKASPDAFNFHVSDAKPGIGVARRFYAF